MNKLLFKFYRIGGTETLLAKHADRNWSTWIDTFLDLPAKIQEPEFMQSAPRSVEAVREIRKESEEAKKLFAREEAGRANKLQVWWFEKMRSDENPLRERMCLFWHSLFTTSYQKVKISYLIYRQNEMFRQFAFGNYKDLVKRVLHDNAMLIYLDNHQNKVNKPNENLSRELLELFTLGVGNYSEQDIREGARILAGLSPGEQGGQYEERIKDNGTKIYLGKQGNLSVDDLVEAIFQHPKIGNRLAEKLIRHFVTDLPENAMIEEYAKFLRQSGFEIKPVLKKLFSDERFEKSAGQMIKSPLDFLLQICDGLQLNHVPDQILIAFGKQQGMELFNPPNVKGWDGGKSWLDVQKLIQRNQLSASVLRGQWPGKKAGNRSNNIQEKTGNGKLPAFAYVKADPRINWNRIQDADSLVTEITERFLFISDEGMKSNCRNLVSYDFDPNSESRHHIASQVIHHCLQSPEYQVL